MENKYEMLIIKVLESKRTGKCFVVGHVDAGKGASLDLTFIEIPKKAFDDYSDKVYDWIEVQPIINGTRVDYTL